MNVVEIINEAVATGRTRFAFELLPPQLFLTNG